MTNVLIVDDQRSARKLLEDAVAAAPDRYQVVETIANALMAEMYCMQGNVDLVLMDVYTAHRENGISAAAQIKKYYPEIKVIIVTSMPENSFIEKSKEAGCESFWYKDIGDDELLDVMDRTMAGESVYPEASPVLEIGLAKSDEFTQQELNIIREKVNGYSGKEICEHLGIKKATLDYHMNNILSKTGYSSALKLVSDVSSQRFIIRDF